MKSSKIKLYIGGILLIGVLILFTLPKTIDINVEHAFSFSEKELYQSFTDLDKLKQYKQLSNNSLPIKSIKIVKSEPYSKVVYAIQLDDEKTTSEIEISKKMDQTVVKWHLQSNEIPFFSRLSAVLTQRTWKEKMENSLIKLEKILPQLIKQNTGSEEVEIISLEKPIQMIGIVQTISTTDTQEKLMAFSESMGILYSYFSDVQKLSFGKEFSEGISIIEKQESSDTQYCIGFVIHQNIPLGEGMAAKTIPASRAVRLLHKGSYSSTTKGHQKILNYLKIKQLKPKGNAFEIYKSAQSVPDAEKITEIYYPIEN